MKSFNIFTLSILVIIEQFALLVLSVKQDFVIVWLFGLSVLVMVVFSHLSPIVRAWGDLLRVWVVCCALERALDRAWLAAGRLQQRNVRMWTEGSTTCSTEGDGAAFPTVWDRIDRTRWDQRPRSFADELAWASSFIIDDIVAGVYLNVNNIVRGTILLCTPMIKYALLPLAQPAARYDLLIFFNLMLLHILRIKHLRWVHLLVILHIVTNRIQRLSCIPGLLIQL